MQFTTIKQDSIVCLQKIRNKCDQFTRSLSEHLVRFNSTEERRSNTCNFNNPQFILKKTDSGKRIFTYSKKNSISLITSHIHIPKNFRQIINKRKLKNNMFENVRVSKKNKHTFFKIIENYQKCHHPTNASKGQNSSHNQPIDLNNSKTHFSQFSSTLKQQQNKAEMKRLSILNQVILQNNRKERRSQKQKSHDRKTWLDT